MKNKNLGFNKDNIGYFQFSVDMQREVLKKDLSKNPDIVSVTIANHPYQRYGTGISAILIGMGNRKAIRFYLVCYMLTRIMPKPFNLKLKEGRFFSPEFSTDNTAIVINEKAAEILGFKDPVGEILSSGDGSKFTIIGVVKDFNFKSLHSKIEPLLLFLSKDRFNCFIKMKPGKTTSIIDYVSRDF